MIEIRDVTIRFGDKTVFENYSCDIPDSGIVVITGESGIGKTTLLRLLAGLQKADSGQVSGTAGRKVSFVFQEPRLLEWMTALDNVASVSDHDAALQMLKNLGMEEETGKKCALLSGGQKQRVAIARALGFSSDLVLLDEPFSGLDEENRIRAAELIRTAKLAVVVTHDMTDVKLLNADAVIRLSEMRFEPKTE